MDGGREGGMEGGREGGINGWMDEWMDGGREDKKLSFTTIQFHSHLHEGMSSTPCSPGWGNPVIQYS